MKFGKFLLSRIATFLLVIFIGVTTVFFVPRLMPNDPVEAMIGQMTSNAGSMSPEAVEQMRESMNSLFGLDGSVMHQYLDFFKRVVISHDFGPSLSAYPTPVMQTIARALPWTLGLMLTTTVLSWPIGNPIGLLAGFRKDKPLSKFLEADRDPHVSYSILHFRTAADHVLLLSASRISAVFCCAGGRI
ncbi:ABC transporter permease [Blautia sp. RD014234]|nr:ABC transporter permease [Blautia parvula]